MIKKVIPFLTGGLISAIMVILSKNPVHAILALVLVFTNAAAILLIIGSTFTGLIIVIIYMGAVSILFLFTLMMLNIEEKEEGKRQEGKLSATIITIIVLTQVNIGIVGKNQKGIGEQGWSWSKLEHEGKMQNTMDQIGYNLYEGSKEEFIVAGLILLVALIAAIMLSLSHQKYILRQGLENQSKMEMTTNWLKA